MGRTKGKSWSNDTEAVSEGTRIDWACDVQNVYQRIVADLMDGDPAAIRHSIERLACELPPPANASESLHLRRSTAMFLDRAGHFAHQRFHISFAQEMCPTAPPLVIEAMWMDARTPLPTLLEGWHRSYADWFSSDHTLPAALRAARLIEQRFQEPWTTARLGRAIGCGRTSLFEQFVQYFGESPPEYLARVRIRNGMMRLRISSDCIDEVAGAMGYQSSNKFYARVRTYTGLTPSQIRALDERQYHRLMQERIPDRPHARMSRTEPKN